MKGRRGKMLLAASLCLILGLQSMGSVQAAVNYEACPFCGTRVTRETVVGKVSEEYDSPCTRHANCIIYIATYDFFAVCHCETPGCQIYHRERLNQEWKREEHYTNLYGRAYE